MREHSLCNFAVDLVSFNNKILEINFGLPNLQGYDHCIDLALNGLFGDLMAGEEPPSSQCGQFTCTGYWS